MQFEDFIAKKQKEARKMPKTAAETNSNQNSNMSSVSDRFKAFFGIEPQSSAQVADFAVALANMEAELGRANSENADAKAKVAKAMGDYADLLQSVEAAKAESEAAISTANAMLVTATAELATAQKSGADLATELEAAKAESAELKAKINGLPDPKAAAAPPTEDEYTQKTLKTR